MGTPEDLRKLNDDLGIRPAWYSLGYSATHFYIEPASAVARHMVERGMEARKAELRYDEAYATNGNYLLRLSELEFAAARQGLVERITNGIYEKHASFGIEGVNYQEFPGVVSKVCDDEALRVLVAPDSAYKAHQRQVLLGDINWLGLMFMLEDDHFRTVNTPKPLLEQ